jgi:hypothetical protein
MNVYAEVSSVDAGLNAIMEAIKELKRHEVLIGIPEDANATREDGVTNAELMFIHNNGSPAKGIPARPILEPAIENSKERVAGMLKKAIDVAVEGKVEGVIPALEAAGQDGVNVAKAWFTNSSNGWAANKPETIARKTPAIRNLRARARKAKTPDKRKELYAEAREKAKSTKANPLIDKTEMRKAITFVVREV